MNSIRKRIYYTISAVLLGVVVAWGSFCTYANNFAKLSFSIDNDVVEIEKKMLEGSICQDNQRLYFSPVDFKHYELNYLKVIADVEESEDPILSFFGYDVEKEWIAVISLNNVRIINGVNYIKLPEVEKNDRQLIGQIVLAGTDRQIIEKACFTEYDSVIDCKGALLFSLLITVLYFTLCIIACFIWRLLKKKQGSRDYP